MSNQAQAWARKIITGSGPRKAILMYLADRSNMEDGMSWPSQQTIVDETEYCLRTVQESMKALEEMGIIRRGKRRGTSDLCWINFEYRNPEGIASKAGPSNKGPRRADTPAGGAPAGGAYAGAAGVPPAAAAGTPTSDAGTPRSSCVQTISEPPVNHQDEPSSSPRKSAPWPEDYLDQFKALYPKRTNNNWREAAIKLGQINEAGMVEFSDIMAGLRIYADRMKRKVKDDPRERNYIAMVVTWINQERWINETPGEDENSRDAGTARMLKQQRLFV